MALNTKPQPIFTSPRQTASDFLLIGVGCILCAIAINGILIPQHFATSGITGIALVIHRKIPSLHLGIIYFLVNLPLFALAWMAVGRRFFFYSLVGMAALSLSVTFVNVSIQLDDKILNALLAGLISGAGVGITLRSSGSQGGIDILSVMLLKRFSIGIGNTILTVNCIVLLLVALAYSLEALLYTLVVIYVSTKIASLVITGFSQRKAVMIISPEWQIISQEILKDIRRGVTIIKGEGGFSGKKENILFTVVTIREVGSLKKLVQKIDPDAFVVISPTQEVMNYRIGNQPHW
ncbi:MAG: YitT family protein [Deltaproteobacteria bacterium]|jgi:uncharacterized membrane-anchored protein YitT (DUF2179 family)|nr:YitT family protein [Deltaproteobacteria bacterium]